MKPVKAIQDDAGHWYLIPNELVSKFHELMEKVYDMDYDAMSECDNLFSQYRTGGDLNNVQLYIE